MRYFLLSISPLLLLALFSSQCMSQDTWTCTRIGNMIVCEGYQNGRWVTCQTTRIGNQTQTQCF
jgi:hypothetical protein